jgi:N-acetyl-1-D-myo-inositol-2-amino-2-deoxy-alpha-D-glucopyranoside deacetylase
VSRVDVFEARHVLFVHAHPDDETLATGALIAELVADGVRVSLLTATRGERGEIVAGSVDNDVDAEGLSLLREKELRRASHVLGIADRYWLGTAPARSAGTPDVRYRDSGMSWIRPGLAGPAADVEADALVSAPIGQLVDDEVALLERIRPELVISYDNDGGYGHPDHVRVHQATLAACLATSMPFAEITQERGDGVTWFDLEHQLPTVTAALREHSTQLSVVGTDVVHSGGQRQAIPLSVGLRYRG